MIIDQLSATSPIFQPHRTKRIFDMTVCTENPNASARKANLIPLADGTFLTPEGAVVTGVEAKSLGFKVPATQAQIAARSIGAAMRTRLGSMQTILTSPGVKLGASAIGKRLSGQCTE